MKWLNDNKILRNVFTVIVWIIAYGAALVWFGIFRNLDLDTIVLLDAGALTIIGLFAVKSLRWDITQRAFIDENVNNGELKEVNENIVNENKKIKNDILAQECVDKYNERKQIKANHKLTDKKLGKLRKKLRKTRIKLKLSWRFRWFTIIKSKDQLVERYEERIKLLEKNPLFNKKYKPVKLEDVINVGDLVVKKELPDHKKANYDPRKDSLWSWVFSLFKFLGIGSTSIPFAINRQDWSILGAFYIALTITALITVIRRYLIIRKRTGGPYLQNRRWKFNFMKNINTYINYTEDQQKIREAAIANEKALILNKDKNIVFGGKDGNMEFVHRNDFINLAESLAGFGETITLAYEDLLQNELRERTYEEKLLKIDQYFNEGNEKFELRVSSELFHKDFYIKRFNKREFKEKYSIRFIAFVKQTKEYFYEITQVKKLDKKEETKDES